MRIGVITTAITLIGMMLLWLIVSTNTDAVKGIFEELYITRAAGFVLCKDGGRIRRFFCGI